MPPANWSGMTAGCVRPGRRACRTERLWGTTGLLIGDKGFILGNNSFPRIARMRPRNQNQTIPRSPGHYIEWIKACKGGKAAGSNFDSPVRFTEAVLLGNVAATGGIAR